MKLTRIFAIGVFATASAMAATSVPGITSTSKLLGTAWSNANGTFTRGTGPTAANLNGATGISSNQPQIWFERQVFVPNVAYQGGATFGGVKVDWLGGTDSLATNYSVVAAAGAGGAPLNAPTTAFSTTRVLATGTSVNSYYFYSNRNNAAVAGNATYAGEIVFTQPILGVIVSNNFAPPSASADGKLNATNSAFGRPGVSGYTTTSTTGWEGSGDRLRVEQLGPTSYKLTFQITGNGFDNFRILTATPEPATWAAFFLIAAVLVFAARRNRQAPSAV